MEKCVERAYTLWESGSTPSYGEDLNGGLTVGYGRQLSHGGWEFPLLPPHRYLPENLRRNIKQQPNGYTLKSCPFCGHQPFEDNLIDSIHPIDREYTLWTAGCVDNEGGCNASSLGGTMQEAIDNWNKRV